MTLHYGTPFSAGGLWPHPSIDTAETIELEALSRCFGNPFGQGVLWRVEAVRYSGCTLDQFGGENYYVTDSRLELFAFPVTRWTPCGATIVGVAGRNKWCDLRPSAKQWASRTPRDALEQLVERRRRQIYILERQTARARSELDLTCPPA